MYIIFLQRLIYDYYFFNLRLNIDLLFVAELTTVIIFIVITSVEIMEEKL